MPTVKRRPTAKSRRELLLNSLGFKTENFPRPACSGALTPGTTWASGDIRGGAVYVSPDDGAYRYLCLQLTAATGGNLGDASQHAQAAVLDRSFKCLAVSDDNLAYVTTTGRRDFDLSLGSGLWTPTIEDLVYFVFWMAASGSTGLPAVRRGDATVGSYAAPSNPEAYSKASQATALTVGTTYANTNTTQLPWTAGY